MEVDIDQSSEFPGIVIDKFPQLPDFFHVEEVLYGLEEEGVPFLIIEDGSHTENLVLAAHRAAHRSVFGVGICCAEEGIVIHHRNLNHEKPLFYLSKDQCTQEKVRLLGINAARLIKGIRFEEI